jgi:hypothetical protein
MCKGKVRDWLNCEKALSYRAAIMSEPQGTTITGQWACLASQPDTDPAT